MPSTNDHNVLSPGRRLWLEVHHAGRTHVFCCAPDEEGAIVLGSAPRADIRVARPGIAPVHFHFEREGDCIILVPTFNAEVRINSMLVRGPVPVRDHALVEFSGVRIEVQVRSTPPEHLESPSLDIPDRESGISYLAALPTDTQTTKLALEAVPRVANLQASIKTREIRLQVRADFSSTQRIEKLVPELVAAAIPAPTQHTLRMDRVAPETFRAPAVDPTAVIETHRLRPIPVVAVVAAEPLLAPPPPEIPSSPAGLGWQNTTAFDLDGLKADLAPTPVPQPVEKSTPPLARSVRPPPPPPPPPSALARAVSRLGERAKAQPVAVGSIALGVAVTLALLMVGISHVAGRSLATTASSHTQARDAAKPNTTPTSTTPSPPRKTPAADTPPASAAIAPTPPSPASAEQRVGAPGTALATTAAAHLVAGRYVEARAAYTELGSEHPENPAYQAMIRLLDRRTGGACSGAGTAPSCPEIVQ